jgi:hypothetical protein
MYVILCVARQWCLALSPIVSRPPGLTIILFAFPDLTVGARLCRAFSAELGGRTALQGREKDIPIINCHLINMR